MKVKRHLSSDQISVLLADDQEIYLTGLGGIVRKISYISRICHARNCDEVEALLNNISFHFLIISLDMPGMKNMKSLVQIKKDFPDLKIIGTSSVNNSTLSISFIHAGGNGILLKNANAAELINCIHEVLTGNNYFSSKVQSSIAAHTIEKKSFVGASPSKMKHDRMHEVLLLICREYTTRQIAEAMKINEKTVEKYKAQLMKISGAKNAVGLVMYALKNNIFEASEKKVAPL